MREPFLFPTITVHIETADPSGAPPMHFLAEIMAPVLDASLTHDLCVLRRSIDLAEPVDSSAFTPSSGRQESTAARKMHERSVQWLASHSDPNDPLIGHLCELIQAHFSRDLLATTLMSPPVLIGFSPNTDPKSGAFGSLTLHFENTFTFDPKAASALLATSEANPNAPSRKDAQTTNPGDPLLASTQTLASIFRAMPYAQTPGTQGRKNLGIESLLSDQEYSGRRSYGVDQPSSTWLGSLNCLQWGRTLFSDNPFIPHEITHGQRALVLQTYESDRKDVRFFHLLRKPEARMELYTAWIQMGSFAYGSFLYGQIGPFADSNRDYAISTTPLKNAHEAHARFFNASVFVAPPSNSAHGSLLPTPSDAQPHSESQQGLPNANSKPAPALQILSRAASDALAFALLFPKSSPKTDRISESRRKQTLDSFTALRFLDEIDSHLSPMANASRKPIPTPPSLLRGSTNSPMSPQTLQSSHSAAPPQGTPAFLPFVLQNYVHAQNHHFYDFCKALSAYLKSLPLVMVGAYCKESAPRTNPSLELFSNALDFSALDPARLYAPREFSEDARTDSLTDASFNQALFALSTHAANSASPTDSQTMHFQSLFGPIHLCKVESKTYKDNDFMTQFLRAQGVGTSCMSPLTDARRTSLVLAPLFNPQYTGAPTMDEDTILRSAFDIGFLLLARTLWVKAQAQDRAGRFGAHLRSDPERFISLEPKSFTSLIEQLSAHTSDPIVQSAEIIGPFRAFLTPDDLPHFAAHIHRAHQWSQIASVSFSSGSSAKPSVFKRI